MKKNFLLLTGICLLLFTLCGCCSHEWIDATCTEPKTCSKCGTTRGEALGHEAGEWEIYYTDYASATICSKQYCERCGEELDTEYETVNPLYEDDTFFFSAKELCRRINRTFNLRLKKEEYSVETHEYSNEAIGIYGYLDDNKFCSIAIEDADGNPVFDEEENSIISLIAITFDDGDDGLDDDAAYMTCTLVMACDPTLGAEEAADVVLDAISAAESSASFEYNGITYELTKRLYTWSFKAYL